MSAPTALIDTVLQGGCDVQAKWHVRELAPSAAPPRARDVIVDDRFDILVRWPYGGGQLLALAVPLGTMPGALVARDVLA